MINHRLMEGNQKAQGTSRSFPLALLQPSTAAKSSLQEEELTGGRDSCGRRRSGAWSRGRSHSSGGGWGVGLYQMHGGENHSLV